MPSSFASSFAPIVNLLTEIAPRRVIDIGPGWGKYGLACREYLPDLQALNAVEVPQGRRPTQDAIYDWTYHSDVRELRSDQFWGRWDLALLIDVIEHMPIDDGHALLNTILAAGCRVLLATPQEFAEQHDDDNPYETHVSLWSWHKLKRHRIERDASTTDAIIYLLSGR